MGLAHQWSEETTPGEVPGSHRIRPFHIAFDRGQTIMWFKKQEDLDAVIAQFEREHGGKRRCQYGSECRQLNWGNKCYFFHTRDEKRT